MRTDDDAAHPEQGQGIVRHGAGFIGSGLAALLVDMGVLSLLTRAFGVSAFVARPVGIALAMLVGWLCQRTFTFLVKTPPSLAEFARYAAVASSAAALNYAIYSAILLLAPRVTDTVVPPEAALVLSSLIAMVFSYAGMKFSVFRNTGTHTRQRSVSPNPQSIVASPVPAQQGFAHDAGEGQGGGGAPASKLDGPLRHPHPDLPPSRGKGQ